MSKTTVNQVIQRAISDAAFRRQLQRDPGSALSGFDLTKDERAAITSGDPTRLTTLGVDQRMSKAFVIGGMGEASKVLVGDAGASTNAVLVDESAATGQGALIDEGATSGNAALIDSGAAGGHGALIDSGATSGQGALIDSSATSGQAVIVGDPSAPDAGGAATVDTSGDYYPEMTIPSSGTVTSEGMIVTSGDYYPEMTIPGSGEASSAATTDASGDYYPEMTIPAQNAGDSASTSAVVDNLDTTTDTNAFDTGLTGSVDASRTEVTDVNQDAHWGGDATPAGEVTAFEPAAASGDVNVLDPGVTDAGTAALDAEGFLPTIAIQGESGGLDTTGGGDAPSEY